MPGKLCECHTVEPLSEMESETAVKKVVSYIMALEGCVCVYKWIDRKSMNLAVTCEKRELQ